MHPGLLESYQPERSPIHRLPAGVKLAGALGLVLGLVGVPRDWALTAAMLFVGTASGLIVVAVLSRLSLVMLLRRLLSLEPFVFSVAALSFWQRHGWVVFWHAVIRSTLCLAALVLLAATTPFSEIVRVLRAWRVPALLLTTLTLMDRYLFVLADETARMQRARASRTFVARSRWVVWRSLAETLGQLFVRSVERAGRIYAAMCARGWQG